VARSTLQWRVEKLDLLDPDRATTAVEGDVQFDEVGLEPTLVQKERGFEAHPIGGSGHRVIEPSREELPASRDANPHLQIGAPLDATGLDACPVCEGRVLDARVLDFEQGDRPRRLAFVLAVAAAFLAVAAALLATAPATAATPGFTYDTPAYTYAASVELSSPNTATIYLRGSPSGPEVASWGRSASTRGCCVAAEGEASLLARANAARDAELSRLTGVRSADRPATVVGAYNARTGNVAVGSSSKVLQECAEACAARNVGGDLADIRFTQAMRPNGSGPPFRDVPVCGAFCEPRYGRGAFPDPLTRFESDL